MLYVCTGNVCRSPMAEYLLHAAVGSRPNVAVASAGMRALTGRAMDTSSAAAVREIGIDPAGHRARDFGDAMAACADLVLTAERGHRDEIMATVPAAARRTFTMKEFARLSRHVAPGSPEQVIARLAVLRGIDGAVPPAHDDIPDPFGAPIASARATLAQVHGTVTTTVAVLDLRPERRPSPARRPRPGPRAAGG